MVCLVYTGACVAYAHLLVWVVSSGFMDLIVCVGGGGGGGGGGE